MILHRLLPPALACASLLLQPGLSRAQARLEASAKDARYDCLVPALAELPARAIELSQASWDKNALGCAADLWAALAGAQAEDPMVQLQALLAVTSYLDHVNSLAAQDLYGVRQSEWEARLTHGIGLGRPIEARLAAIPGDDANLLAARGLYKVTWTARAADVKTQAIETREAMKLFGRAVVTDPKALDGTALWLLGRWLYESPEFAGGDPVQGMKLLEAAFQSTPRNPSLLRYSAYVLAQEHEPARAKQRLALLLKVPSEGVSQQLLADELKGAIDLATRLKDAPLQKQLTARRQALFTANPNLLTRLPPAVNMHGGVDPITGKDY